MITRVFEGIGVGLLVVGVMLAWSLLLAQMADRI